MQDSMQDNIFIHTLFTVSETKQEDGIVILIKEKYIFHREPTGRVDTLGQK